MSALDEAMEEAYASSGDEVGIALTTVELDHSSLEVPIRVVTGLDPTDAGATVMLPLSDGSASVPHVVCGFRVTRPGYDKDGPTDGKLQIDNVSDQLQGPLKAALGYGVPLTLAFRQYNVQPGGLAAVTGPVEEIDGLQLLSVVLTADTAEGSVVWPDGRLINVPTGPNAIFDRDSYPGLFS